MADQTGTGVISNGDANSPLVQSSTPNNAPCPQAQLEAITSERDDLRRKLDDVQRELTALTEASPNADTINKLQQDNDHLRKTLKKATDMLRDKITTINAQEKRNSGLTQQITSLKEVLQVTRDLLNIRNMEVEQLQQNVDSMEGRIEENRRRQTLMIKQMETATKINGQLRNEYETQLKLFQSLKTRYEEKVGKLTKLAYDTGAKMEGAEEATGNSEAAGVRKEEDKTEIVTITEPDNVTVAQDTKESANEANGKVTTENMTENTQSAQTTEAREPTEITS